MSVLRRPEQLSDSRFFAAIVRAPPGPRAPRNPRLRVVRSPMAVTFSSIDGLQWRWFSSWRYELLMQDSNIDLAGNGGTHGVEAIDSETN
ncbi:hypothetical protein [Nocardia farcinica]|uniref:hypothetical protein n=1 Tax=Nocardia farcinica TaxID=37329 RepID=UPI001145992E|nr:hypothetical protein [Nocardia farcinica]